MKSIWKFKVIVFSICIHLKNKVSVMHNNYIFYSSDMKDLGLHCQNETRFFLTERFQGKGKEARGYNEQRGLYPLSLCP